MAWSADVVIDCSALEEGELCERSGQLLSFEFWIWIKVDTTGRFFIEIFLTNVVGQSAASGSDRALRRITDVCALKMTL